MAPRKSGVEDSSPTRNNTYSSSEPPAPPIDINTASFEKLKSLINARDDTSRRFAHWVMANRPLGSREMLVCAPGVTHARLRIIMSRTLPLPSESRAPALSSRRCSGPSRSDPDRIRVKKTLTMYDGADEARKIVIGAWPAPALGGKTRSAMKRAIKKAAVVARQFDVLVLSGVRGTYVPAQLNRRLKGWAHVVSGPVGVSLDSEGLAASEHVAVLWRQDKCILVGMPIMLTDSARDGSRPLQARGSGASNGATGAGKGASSAAAAAAAGSGAGGGGAGHGGHGGGASGAGRDAAGEGGQVGKPYVCYFSNAAGGGTAFVLVTLASAETHVEDLALVRQFCSREDNLIVFSPLAYFDGYKPLVSKQCSAIEKAKVQPAEWNLFMPAKALTDTLYTGESGTVYFEKALYERSSAGIASAVSEIGASRPQWCALYSVGKPLEEARDSSTRYASAKKLPPIRRRRKSMSSTDSTSSASTTSTSGSTAVSNLSSASYTGGSRSSGSRSRSHSQSSASSVSNSSMSSSGSQAKVDVEPHCGNMVYDASFEEREKEMAKDKDGKKNCTVS